MWSGASRSTPINDKTDRKKPSAWRTGTRKTRRSVNAVSIAQSENFFGAPGRPDGDGRHASVASAESHSVTSPRWTKACSYADQFPTRYLTLAEIGEDDGQTLLTGLLARSKEPSLAHFVRNMVGMDRAAAQSAFSGFLSDQSLTPPQIRFVEMVIDQLTARGVMEASALYEPPFSNLHAGGPEALFGGRQNVIDGIFDTLKAVQSGLIVKAG